MIEQDSDEEEDEPTLRPTIHSAPTAAPEAEYVVADDPDDILPFRELRVGRLQLFMSASNELGGDSGRYGEEEHIYQGVGPGEYEEPVRRDAELAQPSEYMVVTSEGRSRSEILFEAGSSAASEPFPVPAPRGKCMLRAGADLFRLVILKYIIHCV